MDEGAGVRFVVLSSAEYAPLAQMAAWTMRHHHPEAEIIHMTDLDTPKIPSASVALRSAGLDPVKVPVFIRTRVELLAGLGDGDTAVLDADTLVCKRLDDLWAHPFDIALTWRQSKRMPYNSGVMFSRKAAFWQGLLERMDTDPWYCQPFGDQESLALEAQSGKWNLRELAPEWNCAEVTEVGIMKGARVVHYKGPKRAKWMPGHFKRGLWK